MEILTNLKIDEKLITGFNPKERIKI